jgi:hypothetical protein
LQGTERAYIFIFLFIYSFIVVIGGARGSFGGGSPARPIPRGLDFILFWGRLEIGDWSKKNKKKSPPPPARSLDFD